MSGKTYNVLFLCNSDTARGIIAEAVLNRDGGGRFHAFSAGIHAGETLNEDVAAMLKKLNYDTASLRPKGVEEFTSAGAPRMHFVFTLCDSVAGDAMPALPGKPMTAHWSVPDPAAIAEQGAERGLKIAEIFRMLDRRIGVFCHLRLDALDRLALQTQLDQIGEQKH